MDPLNASLSHFRETRESPFSLTTTGLAISTDDPNLTKHHEEADSSIPTGKAPAMRICHLCGTPQLLKSFRCHASRCAQAWLQEEAQKPKSQQRSLPEGPEVPPGKPTPKTLEAVNRQAMRIWKEQSLETCPNCGRSFHARALRAHLKGCHGSQDQFLGAVREPCINHVRRDDGVRGCGRVDGVWRHPYAIAASRLDGVQDSPLIFRTGGDALLDDGQAPRRRAAELPERGAIITTGAGRARRVAAGARAPGPGARRHQTRRAGRFWGGGAINVPQDAGRAS